MEELLQAKHVAQILRCSESHVYQLDKRGLLKCSVEWPCLQGKGKRPKVMKRWTTEDVQTFIAKFRKVNNE